MGHHAYDGSFTSVSFVPPGESVNFTVESATVRSAASETTVDAASASTTPADNVVVVSSNATAVLADDLAIVVHPSAFYGAAANITATSWGLSIECGELGTLSVTFSHASYAHDPRDPTVLRFNLTTGSPFVMWLTFGSPHTTPDATAASKVIEAGRSAVLADIAAAAALSKSSFDVVDAMTTAIAWNVNFDPRVAVTAPVSRTFESGFDFIFFGEQRDENAAPRRIFCVDLVVIANVCPHPPPPPSPPSPLAFTYTCLLRPHSHSRPLALAPHPLIYPRSRTCVRKQHDRITVLRNRLGHVFPVAHGCELACGGQPSRVRHWRVEPRRGCSDAVGLRPGDEQTGGIWQLNLGHKRPHRAVRWSDSGSAADRRRPWLTTRANDAVGGRSALPHAVALEPVVLGGTTVLWGYPGKRSVCSRLGQQLAL